MMRFIPILLILIPLAGCSSHEPASGEPTEVLRTEPFDFEVEGKKLSGLLDRPADRDATGTIVLVHSYGETNVVEQNWYYDLRSRFAAIGLNVLIWDKPGCGASEGEFDINQPVQGSAEEVVAAVRELRRREIAGTEVVGLWGGSRAGWIVPLAMQEEPFDFWISLSGVDDRENARYLIETNLRFEGRSEAETKKLVGQWQASFNTLWQDATYEDYLNAAPDLKDDDFIQLMGWDSTISEEEFLDYQRRFRSGELAVDEDTGLMIPVPNFREILSSIDTPVLALFGEKDTNVDWRKAAAIYRETIGVNPAASLTIKTFPDANHSLRQCKTGGIRELLAEIETAPFADGYYDTIFDWLVEHGFGSTRRFDVGSEGG